MFGARILVSEVAACFSFDEGMLRRCVLRPVIAPVQVSLRGFSTEEGPSVTTKFNEKLEELRPKLRNYAILGSLGTGFGVIIYAGLGLIDMMSC